jgi:hypothetical protein
MTNLKGQEFPRGLRFSRDLLTIPNPSKLKTTKHPTRD